MDGLNLILFILCIAAQGTQLACIFNNLPERQAKVNSLLAAQEKAEAAMVTKKNGKQGCQNATLTDNIIISCLNSFPVLKRKER